MTSLWKPSPNFWAGRPKGTPLAIVIHSAAGTLAGVDAWFLNPSSQVSAHYCVSLEGDIHGYVRTSNRAWANGLVERGSLWDVGTLGNPNDLTVSIETEDLGSPETEVSEAQYAAVRTVVRTVHSRYAKTLRWIMGHNQITPLSRARCPGARWWDSGFMDTLALDTGLELTTEMVSG